MSAPPGGPPRAPGAPPLERVLCLHDFSEAAEQALHAALAGHPRAEILVLHVVDVDLGERAGAAAALQVEELLERAWNHADVRLQEITSALRSAGRAGRALLRRGDPVEEALRAAVDEDVAALVLGVEPLEGPVGRGGRLRTALACRSRRPVELVPLEPERP